MMASSMFALPILQRPPLRDVMKNRYPMPATSEIFDKRGFCEIFTVLEFSKPSGSVTKLSYPSKPIEMSCPIRGTHFQSSNVRMYELLRHSPTRRWIETLGTAQHKASLEWTSPLQYYWGDLLTHFTYRSEKQALSPALHLAFSVAEKQLLSPKQPLFSSVSKAFLHSPIFRYFLNKFE